MRRQKWNIDSIILLLLILPDCELIINIDGIIILLILHDCQKLIINIDSTTYFYLQLRFLKQLN